MNAVYSMSAYPLGKLAEGTSHTRLLAIGLALLVAADLILAVHAQGLWLRVGIAVWGLHMGMTQGLLATMVADTAPTDLRGTAFGCFNLVSGLAILLASATAGLLWDRFGAGHTFAAGAVFATLALCASAWRTRQEGLR